MPDVKNIIERETIFLYPGAKKQDNKSFKAITQLVTDIKTIINTCNKQIEHLLFDTCFSEVKCVPSVTMRCVSECHENDAKYGNVRICVVKYDDDDYTNCYEGIINAFKNDKSNISHLVALHICTSSKIIEFATDKSGKFDAIIKTGLENLDILLTSIMMDISLYHYFALSDVLDKRKKFNDIKFKYLYNKFDLKSRDNIYGSILKEDEHIYLPFSLSFINEMESGDNKKLVNDLIAEYASFLSNYLSKKITLTAKRTIKDPYAYQKIATYKKLENYISKNKVKFDKLPVIVLVSENSTFIPCPLVIKYHIESSSCEPWAESLSSEVDEYDIYLIMEEE